MGACNGCAANIVSRLNFAGRMPNASQHIVSFEPRYYNLLKSGSGGSEALESILPMTDQQKEKAMVIMSRELGPTMDRANSLVDGIRQVVRQYSKEEIESFMESGLTLPKAYCHSVRKADAPTVSEDPRYPDTVIDPDQDPTPQPTAISREPEDTDAPGRHAG